MPKLSPALFVALQDQSAVIKVAGRANFTSSVDFKTLVSELQCRGITRFLLDLTECITMDSTFLGVLAGLAIKLDGKADGNHQPMLELLNPNARVTDLLDNLGVCNLFKITQGPQFAGTLQPIASERNSTKRERVETCLEAHRTLMGANPENVPKFKEVTHFLVEDLKKLDQAEGAHG